jgi:hypothetical protein
MYSFFADIWHNKLIIGNSVTFSHSVDRRFKETQLTYLTVYLTSLIYTSSLWISNVAVPLPFKKF